MDGARSIAFHTLGCAKNEVDSEKMCALAAASGYQVVERPEDADVLVVNTCAFITEATEEAIATILEAAQLPRVKDGSCHLVVAGCLPSRYGADLATELPEVSAFLPVLEEERLPELLARLFADGQSVPSVGATVLADRFPDTRASGHSPKTGDGSFRSAAGQTKTARRSRGQSAWAYLKIAEGCGRRCSFCTIPDIRGPYRSIALAELLDEADELVAVGVLELVLIAQDSGRWRDGHRRLPDLLSELASRHPEVWLRVMYLQPNGVSDRLLEVMAEHQNICNYLDIPLQHASARVLREMNRQGNGREYLALLDKIRHRLPDVTLRTTLIAGFPGESAAEARELERFVQDAAFDYVGIFPFSPEEGTPAGERDDQVPPATRLARAQRLRDIADAIGFQKASEKVGEELEVLVCGYDTESDQTTGLPGGAESSALADLAVRTAAGPAGGQTPVYGRTQGQAPEVDGIVHLAAGRIGDRLLVRITDSFCYEWEGEATSRLGKVVSIRP
ncbi:MAG: 30S ribosomal protein S12 methylthiotransferase RimO [Actinomycetia bacterium]|nr:30S ribosomal protein S12 methylthiotransferase RimO [Actinomycetes bacterium]